MAEAEQEIQEIYFEIFENILDESFKYNTIKPVISEWVEENLVLPKEASRISGRYSYDNSPFVKEIINRMHPSDATKQIAIMKGTQCGITTGFIIPFMMWMIVHHPSNILFTSKDKDIAKRTIRTKFDLFMQKSGYSKLIRSNNMKTGGKRTGDTDYLKEYAGGQMAIESTQNIQSIREFAAKYCLIDEYDTAIASDKKEGSMRSTLEGRQNSFGNLAKIAFVSTPTIQQTSNIYQVYLEGDQRKWNWSCPSCEEYSPVEFQVKNDDGTYSGLVWELDEKNKLLPESIRYKFPCCGHKIEFKEKQKINKVGKFVPTAEPSEPNIVSYNLNSLILGPGFVTWEKIIRDWLKACPPKGKVKIEKLKAFNFTHLGLPFEEKGEAPKIMQLMENVRGYGCGIVPDETCEKDGNGEIVLITLAADLGGVMKEKEDVRIDWEILAHTSTGATYSVNHGSCGTFKRTRTKTKEDKATEENRIEYTYMHGMKYSVWPMLQQVIEDELKSESGEIYNVKLSLIDTGHFTKSAYQFIRNAHTSDNWVYGIKGVPEQNFRRNTKDVAAVKKSPNVASLYLLDVEQLKDELAANMKLRLSDDGTQESGFMNFPNPSGKKYQLKTFFKHFKSEVRKEKMEGGESVGFKWEKKNSSVENHFWDVRVYNNAARYIFVDLIKRTDPTKLKGLTWGTLVDILLGK
jgi:phage terminase large subunit GpA-like protein